MDRKILIRVTAPAVAIGLLMFLACLGSAWYINESQANVTRLLSDNVSSLESAHELQNTLRRLHFSCFHYLVDPDPLILKDIRRLDTEFEALFEEARGSAHSDQERACVDQIRAGYERYQGEFQRLRKCVDCTGARKSYHELLAADPLRHIVEPCSELLRINEEIIARSAGEGQAVSGRLARGLLVVALVGPISGLIIGFGVARGLSRSIARLSVRVHDMAQHLEQEVGEVSLATDGDIDGLDARLGLVLARVEEVTQRLHEQHRQIFRAQQLSAVGQLAASMAHEVRNPLTSMKMLVESALLGKGGQALTIDDLRVIRGEIARLERTVQNVLDFARTPALKRSPVDVRLVLTRAVDLVRARARQQGTELTVTAPEGPVRANADAGQLCTVLVNLLINALDALKHDGRVDVSLKVSSRGGLKLSVADTGPGVPRAVRDRLFTPFASTKPTGTGLGLCISRRIVEEHGGRMTLANRSEGGACATVVLPLLREKSDAVVTGHR
jgi:two-component system sensor histidine kinase HydH